MRRLSPFENILNEIGSKQSEMTDLVTEWASVNSYSQNLNGLKDMLKALKKSFSVLPGSIEEISLSNNLSDPKALSITCRPEAPIQVFLCGHMDTVYPPEHPFQRCTLIDTNTLQGPGVADMKGGLVILLNALKAFEKYPEAKNIGWQIFINPDEEIGSPLSSDYFRKIAPQFDIGLAFEPSLPDGSLVRSRMAVGHFSVRAKGRAAHAGRDFKKGRNAIIHLCKFLAKIDELNKEEPEAIFNIGAIEGGGPSNVVPKEASAKLNIRYSRPEQKETIEEKLTKLVASFKQEEGFDLTLIGSFTKPPKPLTEQSEALFKAIASCGEDLGLKLEWKDSGGASDGNTLASAGLHNIDNMGARGNNIHSESEFIVLDSLTERAQLTCLFLMKLASGEISLPQKLFPNIKL